MKDILYSYASNEAGRPVHISAVSKDCRHNYSCIECGAPMIPKLGDVRQHHFSHSASCSCNGESYLHRIAKMMLKKKFDETDSFPIEMIRFVKCSKSDDCPFYREDECMEKEYDSFDLKRYFDTCTEECSVDGYVADLLLSDSTGTITVPVLIEIMVTHRCTGEKRDSGQKIIEIPITSDSDISFFASQPLKEGDVSLFGFQRSSTKFADMSKRHTQRFILYGNGKIFVDEPSCKCRSQKLKPQSVLELDIDSDRMNSDVSALQIGIVKAFDLGSDIRSCIICRHVNSRNGTLDCRMSIVRDTPEHPSQTCARTCPYYTVDTELVAAVREISQSIPVIVVE